MGVASVKNEIKTLFLIVNTFNMIATGLFPVSIGVGLFFLTNGKRPVVFQHIVVGVIMLCVTGLGSYGAILEKTGILKAYLIMAGITTLAEVASQFLAVDIIWGDSFIFLIFHPSTMLFSMYMAIILMKKVRADASLSPSAPIATAL